MIDRSETLAVIGGTGNVGYGLALRWARAGYRVVIGSRSEEKAKNAARVVNDRLGLSTVAGLPNPEAAAAADVVILAVPFGAQAGTLDAIRAGAQGKIVVDVTVPLVPPKVSRVQLPAGDSSALNVQRSLGDGVKVVSAFQNVGAEHLEDLDHEVECDVLVCGDDKAARAAIIGLAEAAGLRALPAGPLANSVATESFTPLLIWMNRHHGVTGCGIRITGLPPDPPGG